MTDLDQRLTAARALSWRHLGKRITFYLPGMFTQDGRTGKHPAVSITGDACELRCDHCRGRLLEKMIPATTPRRLVNTCLRLADKGNSGVLISGGCRVDGTLSWSRFADAIEAVKASTNLFVSVHCGFVGEEDALALKRAGVDQALIDVVGDDRTVRTVMHLPFGASGIEDSMAALERAGLPMVPHVVCGLDHGHIRGEEKALKMIAGFKVDQMVIVTLMPLSGTPMEDARPPQAEAVAEIIIKARSLMPRTALSLGCASQRGNSRLEVLAVDAGVNRLALPSDEALKRAKMYGLKIDCRLTCCSV